VADGTQELEVFYAIVGADAVAVLQLQRHGLAEPKWDAHAVLEHGVLAVSADVRPPEVPQQAALDLAAVGGAVAHEYVPRVQMRFWRKRHRVCSDGATATLQKRQKKT
jgi:hypothetical protein